MFIRDRVYTALIDDVTTWADTFNTSVIRTNLELYRNKAMAGGNLYRAVFGRPYVENQKVIVILPKGTVLQENIKNNVLNAAAYLYS